MSHKHHCCPTRPAMVAPIAPIAPYAGGGGCYNIFSLIILILIVLQFGKRRGLFPKRECGEGILAGTDGFLDGFDGTIDNGILFIITIFLLIWCTCGRGGFTSGCGFGGPVGYGGMGY